MNKLIQKLFPLECNKIPFSPQIIKGADIAMMVDKSIENPPLAKQTQEKVLRFVDLFAGIGGIRYGLEQAAKIKALHLYVY